jgi:hypothetical protein
LAGMAMITPLPIQLNWEFRVNQHPPAHQPLDTRYDLQSWMNLNWVNFWFPRGKRKEKKKKRWCSLILAQAVLQKLTKEKESILQTNKLFVQ